ncbi:glycosyltransferase family 4 protein [Flavobacterium sp. GT3R68]|uniref:glycosyltransferase family 4 protein n=1 Tax=Flavobacterium sp. GT3R68 TaxID=2594437 RepID=UPI000F8984C5|nr:glycosyltransferase family 4 protein [Flavobacterium sp. GT3R68]RTY92245.1 glycosyltransferase [Flavobacterium sp. GSN2]TRW92481.1 glycosyltransferase family 4 protein [Flavobacterium sp. GT3R68]
MKHLLYIGNKLAQHGITETTIETLGPLLENEGYKVIYASTKKNEYVRMLHMLLSVLQNRKSDYVIIDTYSTSSFWYAFATSQLCRLLGKKYIPFLHGGNLPRRLTKNPEICKMIFQHSYYNVAPSHYLLEAFRKHYTNVLYIPNVIEIRQYPYKERNNPQPKILWVRSFAKIYNPAMAVEVLDAIKKTYPLAVLCMVGPDKDGSLFLTQKMAHDKKLDIVFTGKLSKKAWTKLAQEYDIFINTTHFDNMPVSVIEAMALGMAIVSTNVGGIPFLLEHEGNAILVADKDTHGMVSGIQKLLEKPELYKKLTSGARTKAESFDWKMVKENWLKILQ